MRLYRLARPASAGRHLRATFGWMVLVWFLALVALPVVVTTGERWLGIARVEIPGAPVWAAVVLVPASLIGIRCATVMARGEGTPVPFDAAARLVVEGPYRFVRNPMAVTGIAQTVGVALLLGSPGYFLVPPVGALVWHVVIRPSEERFLERCFGQAYRDYRDRVPLWVPRRRPLPRSGGQAPM
ncbi:methyltransferase family protein [Kineococcus gynurae]|uniref:Methyltransferase family protein n=1 Tax=Kineococcus gynurae TaxID=452979 RepID=A0ABV5LRP3_9ACTN